MTSGQLLLEGLELMLIGMGLVFVFLVMLIGCTRLMSLLLQRATVHETTSAVATSIPVPAGPVPDADTLAAIRLALRQHRSRSI
ncbi:OadG family protein [Thiopseudomonas denitrificans]|uniref:Probable oxaloacetate decarboxylase gamma chain n=1 Tax=Thiopseudomonas denitrificans TaxID=1501432 RepID=A0A4R6U1P4_9GAMM|nr:OadG family protein [Thiopseudomonas denitrificans]TDQ39526.1 oxaloacetate decarboxylase gamma subunit [Thiopseudomonas denitrificans]